MEYLAVLLALATTAMANDTAENVATLQAKFVTAGEACIEEYPISGEDITLFKSGQFPDSEHAGCFSACVLRNIGLFDDKGSLYQPDNLEKATEIFNEEKEIETIKELISTCAKESRAAECNRHKTTYLAIMDKEELEIN